MQGFPPDFESGYGDFTFELTLERSTKYERHIVKRVAACYFRINLLSIGCLLTSDN